MYQPVEIVSNNAKKDTSVTKYSKFTPKISQKIDQASQGTFKQKTFN